MRVEHKFKAPIKGKLREYTAQLDLDWNSFEHFCAGREVCNIQFFLYSDDPRWGREFLNVKDYHRSRIVNAVFDKLATEALREIFDRSWGRHSHTEDNHLVFFLRTDASTHIPVKQRTYDADAEYLPDYVKDSYMMAKFLNKLVRTKEAQRLVMDNLGLEKHTTMYTLNSHVEEHGDVAYSIYEKALTYIAETKKRYDKPQPAPAPVEQKEDEQPTLTAQIVIDTMRELGQI